MVLPILAFNFAVWKFRLPARAARAERSIDWLCQRIGDLARTFNTPPRQARPRLKSPELNELCPSIAKHDLLVATASPNTAIAYTDGSALNNPGPCGAGVSIFLFNPDTVVDAGLSLGVNTNNFGELVALHICLRVLLSRLSHFAFTRALIFSDSAFAIQHVTSTKAPKTHHKLTLNTRKLYRLLCKKTTVEIHWIRGHVEVGGNTRVDTIAKRFAHGSKALLSPLSFLDSFETFVSTHSIWAPGFPLTGLPIHSFQSGISVIEATPPMLTKVTHTHTHTCTPVVCPVCVDDPPCSNGVVSSAHNSPPPLLALCSLGDVPKGTRRGLIKRWPLGVLSGRTGIQSSPGPVTKGCLAPLSFLDNIHTHTHASKSVVCLSCLGDSTCSNGVACSAHNLPLSLTASCSLGVKVPTGALSGLIKRRPLGAPSGRTGTIMVPAIEGPYSYDSDGLDHKHDE